MRILLTILLFTTLSARSQNVVKFYTKDSDIITFKGVDTLVDFAGNYKVTDFDKYVKMKNKNMVYNNEEKFWADLVIERQLAFYRKSKQTHKDK